MRLMRDQRGFVLSGIALLLVLPAMLLAASLLTIAGTGGEAVSLQTLSDKVSYTGYDIERMLTYMVNNKLPTDSSTLGALAENYRAATGLLVDIGLHPLRIEVEDTGAIHWVGTKYCQIEEISMGEWRYRFEDKDEELDPPVDWDFNEPILLVKRLDGRLRITLENYDGGYKSDIYYLDQKLWDDVTSGSASIGENREVDEILQPSMDNVSQLNTVIIYVRDPRDAARYSSLLQLR